ncbi:MAG: hypothetical protein A2087_12760 [Spirochaetes bacterium GWD1_61_31]|nr:MAG: hypothetical protein A2Y37_05800 [Spirochaetes bacterium GWB1_60_80]OHD34531.1 MAG: hypothetical protein A2004_08920 [Spirochaetes bacterium GWC1_61_12]OHD38135.1 MAG: hypothetical protein A2087_12760 [Spirochaetes bacterium GWD1_61_31]OHD42977.1 MAG: hypothetical protein A2Y35_14220 [Spirochaetes bacterium GWE1_60_18]OHD58702.1 MAG: hypothetical protein A2Y32_02125 [Spirochaetes bacterium GWF1_60_12]HAP44176.1 potassium transporter [Spirochaetaceae bacterium]
MSSGRSSDSAYLLMFFLLLILAGSLALSLPAAWSGSAVHPGRLPYIDALFTATSAVCVTGLGTVDTADFSRFGQVVILLLIQLGGLGIISFTSILLLVPGRRIPLRRINTIKSFSIDGVEHDPFKIVRSIVFFTFTSEAIGALALFGLFASSGQPNPAFNAVFHAISAFCNAGFSTYRDSLEGFAGHPAILLVVACLIVSGGIGFIVLHDVARRFLGRKRRLSYHSKLILLATAVLVGGGALLFWLLERRSAFAGLPPLHQAVNALFQAITPRTAGFNAVHQANLLQPSKFLTILLMVIGGAPGSIAGGIKVSTAYIVLLAMVKRANERGEINALGRRVSARTINSGVIYFIKAVFLLVCAAGLLSLVEGPRGASLGDMAFEVASAFGTVGLSLDFTPTMSRLGKLIIIATMYAGRVGLFALVFFAVPGKKDNLVYPEADILLG